MHRPCITLLLQYTHLIKSCCKLKCVLLLAQKSNYFIFSFYLDQENNKKYINIKNIFRSIRSINKVVNK